MVVGKSAVSGAAHPSFPGEPERTAPRKHCGICGIGLANERWVYSAKTGARYCPPTEWEKCSTRSVKQKVER